MRNDIKNWIVEWFENNTSLKKEEIENRVRDNYLEKAWIDSFKFISFITDLEKEFNVSFSNDEFQNRKFSTVEGLVEIIKKKINGKV